MGLMYIRMLFMQIFVLFFMTMMASIQNTHGASQTMTIPKTLSYVCKASGVMNITKPNGFEFIVINNSAPCNRTSQLSSGHFVLHDCKNKPQTIALAHKSIIGGKLPVFRLFCNYTKHTVVLNSSLIFTDLTSIPFITIIPDSQAVFLEIRKAKDQSPISSAVIGDKLALVLKAPARFTLSPTVCKAMSGTKSQDIWKTGSSNNCSYDKDVIDTNWNKNSNTSTVEYSITIYAFRFQDSNTVVISCTMEVCPNGVTGCQEVCVTPSAKKRRRRNTSNQNGVKVNKRLEAELRIYDTINDKKSMSGAEKIRSWYIPIVFGIMLLKNINGKEI